MTDYPIRYPANYYFSYFFSLPLDMPLPITMIGQQIGKPLTQRVNAMPYFKVTYTHKLRDNSRQQLDIVLCARSKKAIPAALLNAWHRPIDPQIVKIEKAPDIAWNVRAGDGNMGTYDQGIYHAPTAELAIRRAGFSIARCENEGDDEHVTYFRSSSRLDYSPYIVEAIREY
jgi:hypothetical protein